MNFIVKPIIGAMALTLATAAVSADTKPENNDGKLTAMVKLQHIVDGKDNGYDPNTGTAQLFKLKYVSPRVHGAKLGMGFYAVGDIFNNTDIDITDGRVGNGLFIRDNGASQPGMHTLLGELFIDYQLQDLNVFAGRMEFKSPLTVSAESTLPDFHEVYGASYQATKSFKVGLSHMNKMSIGARGATEFALIGEGTGTAGTVNSPFRVLRGEFSELSTIALGPDAENTNGMSMLNAEYKPNKNLSICGWGYMADNIFNAYYVQANHVTPLQGKKLKLSAQYLSQSSAGDELAGDIDFNMAGLKASIGNKKWGAYAAVNKSSGDTGLFNAFSGDPGFTSTQFSRNEYRENVTAYKVGGKYQVAPKWTLSAGYANYGQSDSTAPNRVLRIASSGISESQTDATELDIAVTFKPTKKTMIKVTHAQRTSEYDGSLGADLTMGHTRLIAVAKF